jgi:hypothetical protein
MITQQPNNLPITDGKGMMSSRFYNWQLDVSNLSVLTGAGSPEGIVAAQPTRFYMDTTGSAGSVLYIKQLSDIGGDRSMGWIAV